MNAWKNDKGFSDRFIPAIKKRVGPLLMVEADWKQDVSEATDMTVLRARDMMVACRVRRHGFLPCYDDQFTIRFRRDSGATTEYAKIISGWADWMFYGHALAGEPPQLAKWWVIDLHAFRQHLIQRNTFHSGETPNGDGTHFKWFRISSFPKEPSLVIAAGCHPSLAEKPIPDPVTIIAEPIQPAVVNGKQVELNLGPMIRKSDYRNWPI